MKKNLSPICAVLLAALVYTISIQAQASAFGYQGRLTEMGIPANGTYQMQFLLFDSLAGATQIGSTLTNNTVTVTNGVFSVELDFSPATPFSTGADRYLLVTVKKAADPTFSPLTPRQKITSSPYALRTLSASASDMLSSSCVGCVSNGNINSVAGSKITGSVSNATTATLATTATTAASATTAIAATTAGNVSGIVALANGGTGSATKNFTDLTTDQTVAGNKTFSGTVAVTGANGKFSGNGSLITNLSVPTATNYLSAYSTLQIFPATTNVFQDVSFTGVTQINGWTLTAGNAFTCPATGIYLITYDVNTTPSSTNNSLRLTRNGVEVEGSHFSSHAAAGGPVGARNSRTMLLNMVAGDVLRVQIAGFAGISAMGTNGQGTTKTSAGLTIIKIN